MKDKWVIILLIAIIIIFSVKTYAAEPALRPWEENPWYWSYHGKPLLLLGGSDDDNLFQWSEQALLAQLDRLAAAGGNLIRNTMSSRQDTGFEVYPFKQLSGGQQDRLYDLGQWNEEYWKRFERMLWETFKRRIIVQIEVWDHFDYTGGDGKRWHLQPYNPRNNKKYTNEESGFANNYVEPPYYNKHPFFFTTPGQQNNQIVLQYQQRFVDKMMDYTLQYDHVLYCIDNETRTEEGWGRYWATYIKQRAKRQNKIVFVTQMWGDKDITTEYHKRTFNHPEIYDFVEVSQNNHQSGQKHWDQFLWVRQYLSDYPRPMNTIKIYGAADHRFGGDQDGIERFWRNLLAGAAAVRFHRPDAGLGLNGKAVASIQAARKLESLIPLWTVEPANDLIIDRRANNAYLAASRGRAFVLYLPIGGGVSIDVSIVKEPLNIRWINIATGEWGPQQQVRGSRPYLHTPGPGNWAAAITLHKPTPMKFQ